MHYLFDKWPELSLKIKDHHICIFLDYDGVLAPIADTPNQAVLPKITKCILKKLSCKPNFTVAIISGRSIKNIIDMVKIKKNLVYAGNHGLEFGNSQTTFEIPLALQYKSEFKQLKKELISGLANIKGVLIEDKKISFSVHYCLANKIDIPRIKSIFKNVITSLKMQDKIIVFTDKKTLEITPNILWNKGKIVLLMLTLIRSLIKHENITPIYIGDGLTDENAFRALKKHGITIYVGDSKRTQADYYIKNTHEVRDLLEKLLVLKAS